MQFINVLTNFLRDIVSNNSLCWLTLVSSLETSFTNINILHLQPYEAYHSCEVQNSEKVPQNENLSSFENQSLSAHSSGLRSVLRTDDAQRGENWVSLKILTSDDKFITLNIELMNNKEEVINTSQSCIESKKLMNNKKNIADTSQSYIRSEKLINNKKNVADTSKSCMRSEELINNEKNIADTSQSCMRSEELNFQLISQ